MSWTISILEMCRRIITLESTSQHVAYETMCRLIIEINYIYNQNSSTRRPSKFDNSPGSGF